jgi:hypothetical protein
MTCFDNSVLPSSGCRIAPEPIASCRAMAEQSAQAWDMGLSGRPGGVRYLTKQGTVLCCLRAR